MDRTAYMLALLDAHHTETTSTPEDQRTHPHNMHTNGHRHEPDPTLTLKPHTPNKISHIAEVGSPGTLFPLLLAALVPQLSKPRQMLKLNSPLIKFVYESQWFYII